MEGESTDLNIRICPSVRKGLKDSLQQASKFLRAESVKLPGLSQPSVRDAIFYGSIRAGYRYGVGSG